MGWTQRDVGVSRDGKVNVVLEQTESLTRRYTDGNGGTAGELFTLPEGFLLKDAPEYV